MVRMNSTIRKRRKAIQTTTLHKHTVDALEHKLTVAEESIDPNDPDSRNDWIGVMSSLRHVLDVPSLVTLSKEDLAMRELADYVCNDLPNDERRMILRDLCRAGYFPVKQPGAVILGTPIKTIQVDGRAYEVGSYD